MGAYLIRRLITNVGVLFVICVGLFILVRAVPGDPIDVMIPPEVRGSAGPEFIEQKRHEFGLDRPLVVQFGTWLGDAVTGDLGSSFQFRRPVTGMLLERIGPTVLLMGTALLISWLLAFPLGILAALRRNSMVDYVTAAFSLGAISIPTFFLGIGAIYVFSLKLQVLPSSGMSSPDDGSGLDILRHLAMPAVLLGLAGAGPYVRYVRSGLLSELYADYVRTAMAKGASRLRAIVRHALRNALIPLVTVAALSIPNLLGGAVVVETVFSWPGMGQLAVSATNAQDYPVITGFALVISVLVIASNLAADLLYAVVDPRVRLG